MASYARNMFVHAYKMAARLLDRTLLEQVGDKAVEVCGLLAFISWLSHLIHSEHAPGQGTVGVS